MARNGKSNLMNSAAKTISNGVTELMRAATRQDITSLLKLLCNLPNVAEELLKKDRKGRTALDWARITRNHLAVTLILKIVSKHVFDRRIERVSSLPNFEEMLIVTNRKQGAALFKALRDRDSTKALGILAANRLVRDEIERINQIYFTDTPGASGYTPLMLACIMNMSEVVRVLIDHKTPLDKANRFGHNALTIATCASNGDIVEYLLLNKANIYHATKEQRTVLHYVCLYKKAKFAKIFFDYLLEQFAVFRIEGHSLIDFDASRWIRFADSLSAFINVRTSCLY